MCKLDLNGNQYAMAIYENKDKIMCYDMKQRKRVNSQTGKLINSFHFAKLTF